MENGLSWATLFRDKVTYVMDTIALVVRSPESGEEFDLNPLIQLLGEPLRYESAVLVSILELEAPYPVPKSWGEGFGYPETHYLATPWVLSEDGTVKRKGHPYPLLKTEFSRRIRTEYRGEGNEVLFKKPGVTQFWHVTKKFAGRILVFSPETPTVPQVAEVGKIIACSKTGAWIARWDPEKYREIH